MLRPEFLGAAVNEGEEEEEERIRRNPSCTRVCSSSTMPWN